MANLAREQAAAVAKSIGPMLGYLVRLPQRMDKVGFHSFAPLSPLLKRTPGFTADKRAALTRMLRWSEGGRGVFLGH